MVGRQQPAAPGGGVDAHQVPRLGTSHKQQQQQQQQRMTATTRKDLSHTLPGPSRPPTVRTQQDMWTCMRTCLDDCSKILLLLPLLPPVPLLPGRTRQPYSRCCLQQPCLTRVATTSMDPSGLNAMSTAGCPTSTRPVRHPVMRS
jgi:hypothetical protein